MEGHCRCCQRRRYSTNIRHLGAREECIAASHRCSQYVRTPTSPGPYCPAIDKNPTLTHISDPHFNRGWRLSTRKSAVSNSTPLPTTLTSLAAASVAWLRRTRLQFARDSRQSEGKSSREHATGFSKMPITERGYAPRLNFSGSRAAQGWAKRCCQSI